MWRRLTVAATGLLLAGCATAQPAVQAPVPTETVPVAEAPTAEASPSPPSAEASASSAPVDVRSAAGVPTPADRGQVPQRLVIDALGADMPVEGVGVEADGQMEIPEDAGTAGWYQYGPGIGNETGSTVLAAHSATAASGRGPLRNLIDLEAGDTIEMTDAEGGTIDYIVESTAMFPKATIDLTDYFRRDGEPRLVLITCDGEWQEDRRSYTDNAVVVARPE